MDNIDTYEGFISWYKEDFIRRNGGFTPSAKYMKPWYDKVLSCHSALIRRFSGFRLQRKFDLKQHQNIAPLSSISTVIDAIKQRLPDYLRYHGFTDEIFAKPMIPAKNHGFTKTAKHICNYASSLYKNVNISSSVVQEINKLTSELGQYWSKYRVSDVSLEATISCSPKAFVLLGHYGPDHDSCFRQGSTSQKDKYVFAQTTNTYVVTISQKHHKKDKNVNIGRILGYLSRDNVFNFFNYYFNEKLNIGDTVETLRLLVDSMLPGVKSVIAEDKLHIGGGVHFNRTGLNLSFYNPDITSEHALMSELYPDKSQISEFRCPVCGHRAEQDEGFEHVDEDFICHRCASRANICGISGRKTLRELLEYSPKCDGQIIGIHPDLAKDFILCNHCNILCKEEHITKKNDIAICNDCLKNEFVNCDICNSPIIEGNEVDIGDISVCQQCLTNCQDKVAEEVSDLLGELECLTKPQ